MDYNKCMPKVEVDPQVKKVLEALEGLPEDTPSGIWLNALPDNYQITTLRIMQMQNDGIRVKNER